MLKEDRNISNNGAQFPNYGWAFFITGSPGSGKNYIYNNLLPIHGKVFDLDEVVDNITKLRSDKRAKEENKKNVTTGIIQDVRRQARKDGGQKIQKNVELFLANNKQLDNIIMLCTGHGPDKDEETSSLQNLIYMAKEKGYKICVIHVAANASVALKRNISRGEKTITMPNGKIKKDPYARTVPDSGFHSKTNSTNTYMPKFLKTSLSNNVDMAYIILSSGENLNDEFGDQINNVIKLEKAPNGDGFIFPKTNAYKPKNKYVNSYDELEKFLGPKEKNTKFNPRFYEPETYLSIQDIKKGKQGKDGTYLRQTEPITESQLRKIIKETILEYLRK